MVSMRPLLAIALLLAVFSAALGSTGCTWTETRADFPLDVAAQSDHHHNHNHDHNH
jgi:hypothetical protein